MFSTLQLLLETHRIISPDVDPMEFLKLGSWDDKNGMFSTEVDDSSFLQAQEFTQEKLEKRLEAIYAAAEEGDLPDSAEASILTALSVSSHRVKAAEETRTELIGLAVHGAGISLRKISEATKLHSNTVAKRASERFALNTAIRLKKAELEELENLANEAVSDTEG